MVPGYKVLHEQCGDFEASKYCLRTVNVIDGTIVMIMMGGMRTLNVVDFRIAFRFWSTESGTHSVEYAGGCLAVGERLGLDAADTTRDNRR